jgi:hypothetical protein
MLLYNALKDIQWVAGRPGEEIAPQWLPPWGKCCMCFIMLFYDALRHRGVGDNHGADLYLLEVADRACQPAATLVNGFQGFLDQDRVILTSLRDCCRRWCGCS